MDSFEFNKIAGAVLGTLLLVLGLKNLSGVVFHNEAPEKAGFMIAAAEADTGGAKPADAAPAVPIATLLASADVAKGQATAKACAACHDFTKGGPNKVGPNLWDVVGRPIASHPDFNYSDALKAASSKSWTYEELNLWILSPSGDMKGTKMSFAGLKKDQDRADVIAYLGSLSDSPKPFPAP
ncbi:MAG: cytochrome c family protein [Aestuariivirga sp.]